MKSTTEQWFLWLFSSESPRLLGLEWPRPEHVTLYWLASWPLHILPNVVLKQVPLTQLLGGLRSGSLSQECSGEGTKTPQINRSMAQCWLPEQVPGTKQAGLREGVSCGLKEFTAQPGSQQNNNASESLTP